MTIDATGILWIPLFGSGEMVKYDTNSRREVARYELPDRSAAPYAVTWDARRKVVWVANSNVDSVYRFDPATERFTVLPLPRQEGYLRQLALHPESNDLIVTYANLPVGSGPSMALTITPGD
jgi:streptogramin lyase